RLVDVGERLARVRLALLERELTGEVLATLGDQVGDRVADLGPLPGRARGPHRLRTAGGLDRGVDVRGARVGRLGERLARDGGDDGAALSPVAATHVPPTKFSRVRTARAMPRRFYEPRRISVCPSSSTRWCGSPIRRRAAPSTRRSASASSATWTSSATASSRRRTTSSRSAITLLSWS